MANESRKERRRRERQESRGKRVRRSQRKSQGRKRKKFFSYAVVAATAAVVGYGVYAWSSRELPGKSVADQGNSHVAFGASEQFPYNTNPPTSGPHYAGLARWGVHKKPIAKGLQIHGLEDGGVFVQYRCRNCPELIGKVEKIVSRYSTKVVAAPYPKMKPLIALTAWGRIERLDKFDEERIVKFIEAYRGIDHHR